MNTSTSHTTPEAFETLILPFAESIAHCGDRTIALTRKEGLPVPAVLHLGDTGSTPHVVYHAGTDDISIHGIMTQLGTLERVLAARAAGVNRSPLRDQRVYNRFQDSCAAKIKAMRSAGTADSRIAAIVEGWFNGLIGRLVGTPMHIVVESTLHARHPAFHRYQIVGLEKVVRDSAPVINAMTGDAHTPPFVAHAAGVIALVLAILLKDLGGPDLVKEFSLKRNHRAAAEHLYAEAARGEPPAGREWDLSHRWAQVLHLENFFETQPDSAPASGPGFSPDTDPVIVGDASQADVSEGAVPQEPHGATADPTVDPELVATIAASLSYLRALPEVQVKRITLEMAEIGSAGFNPEDRERRFTVSAIPGSDFTGQELAAWTYTGFQLINPDLDTGLNYAREFAAAQRAL